MTTRITNEICRMTVLCTVVKTVTRPRVDDKHRPHTHFQPRDMLSPLFPRLLFPGSSRQRFTAAPCWSLTTCNHPTPTRSDSLHECWRAGNSWRHSHKHLHCTTRDARSDRESVHEQSNVVCLWSEHPSLMSSSVYCTHVRSICTCTCTYVT